jgi:pyruvate dehydrogenase E1 component alpha subunit
MEDGIARETKMRLYTLMVRIRAFEEKSLELFELGLTPGRMHPYFGEEGIAAGACAALRMSDVIVSTHRNGGHLVAQGAGFRQMFAEYMGRAAGYSGGKGGPMHFCLPEIGVLCTNGIVGSGIPVAAGAAMACRLRKTDQTVLCFFGDGAANTGAFHEGLNMASLWKLPVILLCENNCYAETMPVDRAIPIDNIADRAAAYGMRAAVVDGNDVMDVYMMVGSAAAQARAGRGPTLIEAKTYRIGPHFSGESGHYRDPEEIERWRARDPIARFRKKLLESNPTGESELDEIDAAVHEEAERAAEQAKSDPFPEPDSLLQDAWVPMIAEGE